MLVARQAKNEQLTLSFNDKKDFIGFWISRFLDGWISSQGNDGYQFVLMLVER